MNVWLIIVICIAVSAALHFFVHTVQSTAFGIVAAVLHAAAAIAFLIMGATLEQMLVFLSATVATYYLTRVVSLRLRAEAAEEREGKKDEVKPEPEEEE